METVDVISLATTIALGLISIALAGFAIWLSLRFNQQSTSALDSVKSLATEIRSLIDATLDHQKSFSDKMLDSILSKDAFGRVRDESETDSALADLLRQQLEETESRIAAEVEEKVEAFSTRSEPSNGEFVEALNHLRQEIRSITGTAAGRLERTGLPADLRAVLEEWRQWPGFYVLLAAIIKGKAHSASDLRGLESKYAIPPGWEDAGLEGLRDHGVILGPDSDFHVNSDYLAPLAAWVDMNWPVIRQLMISYGQGSGSATTAEERRIAQSIVL